MAIKNETVEELLLVESVMSSNDGIMTDNDKNDLEPWRRWRNPGSSKSNIGWGNQAWALICRFHMFTELPLNYLRTFSGTAAIHAKRASLCLKVLSFVSLDQLIAPMFWRTHSIYTKFTFGDKKCFLGSFHHLRQNRLISPLVVRFHSFFFGISALVIIDSL